jgi:hypothetical protein
MTTTKEHQFRPRKLPARTLQDATRRFTQREGTAYEPDKDCMLWTAGSDLWDDANGADSDVFRNPDSELIVSGHEYYVVTYSCRAGADSAKVRIGWWSAAFVKLHCGVPFVVLREF